MVRLRVWLTLILAILYLQGCDQADNRLQTWNLPRVDPPGLLDNAVMAIHQSADGALWFGTFRRGVSRYEPVSGQWQSFTTADGLADDYVLAVVQSHDRALWFGTFGGGVMRLFIGTENQPQAGSMIMLHELPDYSPTLVTTRTVTAISRPLGIAFVEHPASTPTPTAVPTQNPIIALAAGPKGSAWTGERLGGLHLRHSTGEDQQLTEAHGLPSMQVNTLAPVPGQKLAKIWAGTDGGAVRVALADKTLRIERTATLNDGLPPGPVKALTALADGSAFLAYNAIDAKFFLDDRLARRRASSHVRFVPAAGDAGPEIALMRGGERLAKVDIRILAMRGDTLWAATSAGLLQAKNPRVPGAPLQLLDSEGSPQAAIRRLVVHPKTGDLWVIADPQEDVPARVIGYDPDRDLSITLSEANGIPPGLPIHDLAFSEQGELVVLVGGRLVKGRVSVGGRGWLNPYGVMALTVLVLSLITWFTISHHPLVVQTRRRPEVLRESSLAQIAVAMTRLKWARALEEVRQRLGLSKQRLSLLKTLAASQTPEAETLRALAELLGMEGAGRAEVRELRPGLRLLMARFDYPEPLRGREVPLFGLDRDAIGSEDETRLREIVRQALIDANHRFEIPFVLYCRDASAARGCMPDGYAALIIDEPLLRELLFAASPQQTFAGLLLTRGLLALSPYKIEGEVKNPAMFYGRERLLGELLQAESLQFLLIGPRRVGKSSLLRRLLAQLPERRPELRPVYLDLLGIDDLQRVLRQLARALNLPAPEPGDDPRQNAALIGELLREHFTDPTRPGVLLIDETDALVEADASAGFPLLAELRSIQAEGICSFVLAGYWHLFRWTLDHGSPVYNFAPVKRLGRLEADAGRRLASEPMARLGLSYAEPSLPGHLVEKVGGYPSLIQLLCDQMLEELKADGSLILSVEHLERAERSQRVRDYLVTFFRFNTAPGGQLLVYRLLENEAFGLAEAHEYLEKTTGKEVPLWVIERILLQLVLYGLVQEADDRYSWTIPLVRDTLLAGKDREHRVTRLLGELSEDFNAWITPSASVGRGVSVRQEEMERRDL